MHHVVAPGLPGAVGQAGFPYGAGAQGAGLRTQQQCGRVDRSAGQHETPGLDTQLPPLVLGQRRGHPPSGRAGHQPGDGGPGQQRDVARGQRGTQRAHVGVALGLDQAREAVAGGAAQARAVRAQIDAGGQRERLQTLGAQRLRERGDRGFVGHRGPRVLARAPGVGRIGPARAVHPVEAFGARVVRLQHAVRERPAARDALRVLHRTEVGLPEARQGGAEDLGVAADVVVHAGVEIAVGAGVVPGFGVAVAPGGEDRGSGPVLPLPGRKSPRSTTRTRAPVPRRAYARVAPPMPEPMTAMSQSTTGPVGRSRPRGRPSARCRAPSVSGWGVAVTVPPRGDLRG